MPEPTITLQPQTTPTPEPFNKYYVDSVSGNDNNNGTSQDTPWKTLDKVNSQSFLPGDTILLKRERTFPGSLILSDSGTKDSPITYTAYGAGNRPLLIGSKSITTWTNVGGDIYSAPMTCTPEKTGAGIILEDGTPLHFYTWDNDFATTLGSNTGAFTYDPSSLSSPVLYIRCSDSLSPASHSITAGFYLFGIFGDLISDIRIQNLAFSEYSLQGINIKSGTRVDISNCVATKIGGATLSLSPVIYGGNGFEFSNNSNDCSITASVAEDIFDSGFSPQLYKSHTSIDGITYDTCIARRCGFAGIEISVLNVSGSVDEVISNVSVVNCIISDCGDGWTGIRYGNEGHGIRIKADDGSGSISGVSIEKTAISDCRGSGIYIGGDSGTVTLHRNLITGSSVNAISCIGSSTAYSNVTLTSSIIANQSGISSIGVYISTAGIGKFELIQNTFINNNISLQIDSSGEYSTLINNIFYSTNQTYIYAPALPVNPNFDYNCFYEHGGNIIGIGLTAYTGISSYKADTGIDQHSIGDDPDFVNAASDWNLNIGSPCSNTGIPTSVALDYDGNPFDASHPSRGAYQ